MEPTKVASQTASEYSATAPLGDLMNFYSILFCILLVSGAFGGLINLFLDRRRGDDRSAAHEYIAIGIAASFLVPLFLNMIKSDLIKSSITDIELRFVIGGFCLMASMSAIKFIETVTNKALQNAQEAKRTSREAKVLAVAADTKAERAEDDLSKGRKLSQILAASIAQSYTGEYLDAVKGFDVVIQDEPELADPYAWKAYALKRLTKYDEAVDSIGKAIELEQEKRPNWLYNLACYKALAGHDVKEIVKDIKTLAQLEHPRVCELLTYIEQDEDFNSIKSTSEFKQCLRDIGVIGTKSENTNE